MTAPVTLHGYHRSIYAWAALLALGIAAALAAGVGLGGDPFLLNLAGYTCGFAIFALSVNVMLGGLGEVPLGHCMFYGIGAYAPAMAMNHAGLPYEAGAVIGMVVAALIADGHDVNELCGPGRRHGRGVTAGAPCTPRACRPCPRAP